MTATADKMQNHCNHAPKQSEIYIRYIKNTDETEKDNMKKRSGKETEVIEDTADTLTQDSVENDIESSENEEEIVEETVEEKLERERDELKNQVMRMAAEMENLRKRSQREKNDMVDFANERLLFQMLPVLDDLTNALKSVDEKTEFKTFLSGIEMIYKKTVRLFENASVKEMEDPIGQPFDVDKHDAVLAMPSEYPEGDVCQLAQPGYMMKSKVLRHAKVVTSQGQPTE